jgi:hypothetical protein
MWHHLAFCGAFIPKTGNKKHNKWQSPLNSAVTGR